MESNKPQELSKGSRVGQLVITPVVIADFVSELGEQRGKGGFVSAPVIKCKKTPRKKCNYVAERREKR